MARVYGGKASRGEHSVRLFRGDRGLVSPPYRANLCGSLPGALLHTMMAMKETGVFGLQQRYQPYQMRGSA